jgi:hypothetical protein
MTVPPVHQRPSREAPASFASAKEKAKLMFDVDGTRVTRGTFTARSTGVMAALKNIGGTTAPGL